MGGHVPTLLRPCWVIRFPLSDQKFFWGRGREDGRTDSATNLARKAFDNCKVSIHIWLLGDSPPDSTGAPPLDPWGTYVPQIPVPTLTSEPGYTSVWYDRVMRCLIPAEIVMVQLNSKHHFSVCGIITKIDFDQFSSRKIKLYKTVLIKSWYDWVWFWLEIRFLTKTWILAHYTYSMPRTVCILSSLVAVAFCFVFWMYAFSIICVHF